MQIPIDHLPRACVALPLPCSISPAVGSVSVRPNIPQGALVLGRQSLPIRSWLKKTSIVCMPWWGRRFPLPPTSSYATGADSRSRAALNSQPISVITDQTYIHTSSASPAPTLPYSTL
jgi:hypothetical protein